MDWEARALCLPAECGLSLAVATNAVADDEGLFFVVGVWS